MIVGCIGICRSGKTRHMQRLVGGSLGAGWLYLVLDCNGEWPGVAGGTWAACATPYTAERLLRAGRHVLVRPAYAELASEARARAFADALAFVACTVPADVCLVLPEVHRYCAEGQPLPDHFRVLVHQHFHVRAGLLFDTQQFQDLKKEILRDTQTLYLFAQSHPTSLKELKKLGGTKLASLSIEANRRLQEAKRRGDYRQGSGWHVRWAPGLTEADFELVRAT